MFCGACGGAVAPGNRFCTRCGGAVGGVAGVAATAPPGGEPREEPSSQVQTRSLLSCPNATRPLCVCLLPTSPWSPPLSLPPLSPSAASRSKPQGQLTQPAESRHSRCVPIVLLRFSTLPDARRPCPPLLLNASSATLPQAIEPCTAIGHVSTCTPKPVAGKVCAPRALPLCTCASLRVPSRSSLLTKLDATPLSPTLPKVWLAPSARQWRN